MRITTRLLALGLANASLAQLSLAQSPGTYLVHTLRKPPVLDGRVDVAEEYGDVVSASMGPALIWIGQHGDFLHIAATLSDTSYYWGDDFVVSIDPDGSGGASPGNGDRQWYLRRTLDSSVIATASNGRWYSPGNEPPMLGQKRHDGDWDVASASTSAGWSVELRIRTTLLKPTFRIAFRTYNDQPQGWWSWPAPPEGTRPQRVEQRPDLWTPQRLF